MKTPNWIRRLIASLAIVALTAGCSGGGSDSSSPASAVDPVPVADAGAKQSVVVDNHVTLNGSASRDSDRELLTYTWTLTSRPAGSRAVLQDPTSPTPVFVADVAGTYVATLVVHNGRRDSAPASVTIVVASANAAPVADAGPAQNVVLGDPVLLTGAASTDANGDRLSYRWSLVSKPGGSAVRFADATTATQAFVADVAGVYLASLVVNDGRVDSAPATVTVTAVAGNAAPVANAGPAQNVLVGATVRLDGFLSSDANGDRLTYGWTMQSRPSGSAAALTLASSGQPQFNADVAGVYVVSLTVSDGALSSAPSAVTVTATAPGASIDLLAAPRSIGTAVSMGGLALADMNGDGKPDIVVGTPAGVGVMLGDGAGNFGPIAVFPVSAGAGAEVVVGDLNRDGKLDVVVGGGNRPLAFPPFGVAQFSVLLGDGRGGLGSAASYDAGGYQANRYQLVDLDGDGRLDLMFSAAAYHAGSGFWVGFGDGAGGFGNWTSPWASNFNGITAVAGDVDADGTTDLVVGDPSNIGSVLRVLRGAGARAFNVVGSTTLAGPYSAAFLRDFNLDGKLDLLSSANGVGLSVFPGGGNGTFAAPVPSACVAGNAAVLGDLNRDGKLDLVSPLGDAASTLSVCLGDGQGRFSLASPIRSAAAGVSILAVSDVNGDGKLDVVSINVDGVSLSVYLGK